MKTDWFEMWLEDRRSIAETMWRNMYADLDAGYDPNGHCIRKQRVEVEDYEAFTDLQLNRFATMDDAKVQRWCYYDMKKRGAI